jgi:hypothetical protein
VPPILINEPPKGCKVDFEKEKKEKKKNTSAFQSNFVMSISGNLLLLKFAAALVLAFASVAGCALPLCWPAADRRKRRPHVEEGSHADSDDQRTAVDGGSGSRSSMLISLSDVNCFSAGLLLATGMFHFFIDAVEVMSGSDGGSNLRHNHGHANKDQHSPWVSVRGLHTCLALMLVGLLLPIVAERLLVALSAGGEITSGHSHCHVAPTDSSESSVPSGNFASARLSRSSASTTLVALLLSVHSLFEGSAMGLLSSSESLTGALLPMTLHKACDGLILGVSIAKGGPSGPTGCVPSWLSPALRPQVLGWILVTPVALVAAGLMQVFVQGDRPDDSSRSTATIYAEAATQCISSGSFVFIAVCEVASAELLHSAVADWELIKRFFALIIGVLFVLSVKSE